MLTVSTHSRRAHEDADTGFALVAVVIIGLLLGAVILGVATYTLTTSVRSASTRNTLQATHAAEAGMAQEQGAMSTWTACPADGSTTPYTSVALSGSTPNVSSYTVIQAVTAFAGGCNVKITSTGQVRTAAKLLNQRKVQNSAVLTAATAAAPYAFFASGIAGSITGLNVTGSAGSLFRNTTPSLNCNSGSTGPIQVDNGGLSFQSGACAVNGDVLVTGDISAQNGGSVSGNVTSSLGSINFGQNASPSMTVTGTVRARGSVTWNPACTATKCYQNQSNLAGPVVTAPPTFGTSTSQKQSWSSAGYSDQQTVPCTGDAVAAGTWVGNAMTQTNATGLLLTASCDITFQNISNAVLGRNVVILTNNNITTASAMTISGGSSLKRLYLIGLGANSTVTANGDLTAKSNIQLFLQTPYLTLANKLDMVGQLYVTSGGGPYNSPIVIAYTAMTLYGTTGGSGTPTTAWQLEREIN